jgi:hypothetical protein
MWGAALEPIDEAQCLELLKQVEFGGLGIRGSCGRTSGDLVNFGLHGYTVVFVTGSAVMQAGAARSCGIRSGGYRLGDV